ncbi:MAG: hypothetical protein Q7U53_15630 [Anaerolineaceae bacterium]|nr:hypothetical protein [Anaerolineaceae bacterium]
MSLALNDNVVLTDLAYEKARRLGMSLISPQATTPPAAPVRPYLSQQNQMGERARVLDQSTPLGSSAETRGIPPLAQSPSIPSSSASGFPQPVQESSVDVSILRQELQQQIGTQFPAMDKALLSEIIERVLRRFGIV